MVRAKWALAALLIASVGIPAAAWAQTSPYSKRHHPSAAMARREAACKQQANAQNLHFEARLNFLNDCMRHK